MFWIRVRGRLAVVFTILFAILCFVGLIAGLVTGKTFVPSSKTSVISYTQQPITFTLILLFDVVVTLAVGLLVGRLLRRRWLCSVL